MKLVRFGDRGREKPGLLKGENIVDLQMIFPDIPDIGEEFFRDGWVGKIESVRHSGEKLKTRLGCPVYRPSKIICLGKNYSEHAKEGGFKNPEKPLLFCKSVNALNGPHDDIQLPESSSKTDWEVELAVVIGKEGKRIKKSEALEFIAGVTIMNDVSGREAQFSDKQWYRGKSFDTFAPMGPVIVTRDEIGDIQNLNLFASLNGRIMQEANTADMIFDIPTLISYISQDITLIPGDIISTGTPAGVGIFRDPPIAVKSGDVVECGIEKIGRIKNRFV